MQPILYLMVGYPGAGKTTTARIIHELTGAEHLWADRIRNERYPNPTHSHAENLELYDYLNGLTADLLASGRSVVFDTGFNFYKDRQRLRQIAAAHGAETLAVWVQTAKELAKERATQPGHAQRNSYPEAMEEQRFEELSHKLEEPRQDENVIKVDGTKISAQYIEQLLNRKV